MKIKNNRLPFFAILVSVLLFSCTKEELTGPQGPAGPQGPQGVQGPAGSSNILGAYQVEPQINWFVPSLNGIWQYQTLSSDVPSVNMSNNTVLGFMAGTVTTSAQWAAMPYDHYWSSSTSFVKHYFSVAPNGRIWIYMRHSSGGTPYSNQNSSTLLGYRFYILKSTSVPDDLDITSIDAVQDFASRNPEAVVSIETF